jgi:hypothetical protein
VYFVCETRRTDFDEANSGFGHRHSIFVSLAAMASPGQSGSESHSNGPTFSLENILGNDHDKLEHPDIRPEGWDEEDAEREVAHGYCIECEGAWYYSPPVSSPFMRWVLQTNQRKCAVKHVRMITAKCASQRNIEKAAGKSIPRRP